MLVRRRPSVTSTASRLRGSDPSLAWAPHPHRAVASPVRTDARVVATPYLRRSSRFVEFSDCSHGFLDGVRRLPGVMQVFPASAGISRWFAEPITGFTVDGPSVRAWVTVALDRGATSAAAVRVIGAYLHARLAECGFDLIEVRVRVALLG